MNRNELDQYLEIINNVLTQSATKLYRKIEFFYTGVIKTEASPTALSFKISLFT